MDTTSQPLRGRCALVTGGGRRIGRELALALGKAGAIVVVHYLHSADAAHAVAAAIGAGACTVQTDLGDADKTASLIDRAAAVAGRPVDILVNNASVFETADASTTRAADWDRTQAVNLRAPFLLAQGLARQLPAGVTGAVVNLGDIRALRPGADHFSYTVSKAGLHGLTRSLAVALAPRVRVNELALGAILPPVTAEGHDYDHVAREDIPTGRFDTPQDVAHALLFLLTNPAVTGQTICIDGGRHLI